MPSAPQLLTRLPALYARLRHAAANPFVRAGYFALVALAAMWTPLSTSSLLNAYQDAQHFTLFEEAARIAVARFHELPLWDPYYCGGIPGLGTPSARFASPTFLLTLGFGTLRGAALAMLLMTFLGMEGAFRYARARGAGTLGAMMAAPVFALSGLFAHATLVAWTNFYGFELVPWVLLGVRRSVRGSSRGLVLTALAMGWMIGFGGTYTAPLTALAAAFEVLAMTVSDVRLRDRSARLTRMVTMGVLVVLLTLAVSMLRLWPVAENLASSPRLLGGKPGTVPMTMWKLLFGEWSNHFGKGDFLIGLPVLPLVLFGIFRRRSLPVASGIALWLWFALGYKTPLSIFAALRTIPPYTMLRAPERFLIFIALAAATLAALGIRKLEIGGRRSSKVLALALAANAVLLGDTVLLVQHATLRASARHLDPEPPVVARDFRQARGNRWLAGYYPLMSRGSLTCFDDYDVAQSPELRGDLPAEEYLRDADAGTVKRVAWSPDRIDLQVDLVHPARVYVNQNWHPGWHATEGLVVSDEGLLAVDLPAGSRAIALRFRPRSALGGILTTVLGLLAAAFIAWRSYRGPDLMRGLREWGLVGIACALPLLAVPLAFASIHEPPRPPPPLLTQTGEPMLVDKAPEDTTPIGARWIDGVVLDAAAVELEPADETHGAMVHMELDWRFEQPVPPGLGVFVQFERQGGRFATDHVLLSGVLVPEDAPLHTVIRDLSDPVPLPDAKTTTVWKVYVGFWRARRDMSRMAIIDPGTATVAADRVLVGTVTFMPPQPSASHDGQTP